MRATERDDPAASTLERAVGVLDAFAADDAVLSVSELGRRAGLAKSTAHRLAAELCRLGLLERTPRGLRLGLHLFELGQLVPRQRSVREAALPLMEDLREVTRSTVHLAVLEGVEVVYVEILRPKGAPTLGARVGGRMPAHATGVGKAVLAFSPPEVVTARIDAGLPSLSPFTIVAPGALLRELSTIRATGLAFDRQESGIGTVCTAAPVLAGDGRPVAALSVSGKSSCTDAERAGVAVRTAALALGRQLAAQGH
jgi:DNA-binding IclR family transcriptional regulator